MLAHYTTQLSKVFLFWAAFVLTRPFGATMGDFLTKPVEKGGINLGTIGSSLILASVLGIFIVIATVHEFRKSRSLRSRKT